MAIGIWTPVANSAIRVSFGDPSLRNFADKVRQVTPINGTHMRIRPTGCEVIYVCTANPANDAAGLLGTPVYPESDFVLPYVATIWLYSPYEAQTVQIDSGTLS